MPTICTIGGDNSTIHFMRQADIRMDKEVLFISENKVEVNYMFTNTSTHDLTVPVAFPMPPIVFDDEPTSEVTNFKLWVNGRPMPTKRRLVAKLGERDISREWAATGWTIDDMYSYADGNNIPAGKRPLPKAWLDKDGSPKFSLSEYYIWQQYFPAGKSVFIRHSYKPSVSSGVPLPISIPEGGLIDAYGKSVCLDSDMIQSMHRRERDHKTGEILGLNYANLSYILTTGRNWDGPIGDFHLIIKKSTPDELVSTCFNGLEKTDPLTFQFHRTNYMPDSNLDVLFMQRTE